MATNPIDQNEQHPSQNSLGAKISPKISQQARSVLEAALAHHPKRSLYEVLASMPNVGEDSDFERHPR